MLILSKFFIRTGGVAPASKAQGPEIEPQNGLSKKILLLCRTGI
jgi:hypothetical protein